MKILFEDKKDDVLSRLFRKSLPKEIQERIEYANGNGNLIRKAQELLRSGGAVLVILDTVPSNKSIRDIYVSLRRLSRQNEYRLIVWNVVCAEYYFIKAFGSMNQVKAFLDTKDLEIVLERKPFGAASIIQTEEDRIFSKNFEKFCKLYILKNGADCVNQSEIFFTKDCICQDGCERLSLIEKSTMYRAAYQVLFEVSSPEMLWTTHRKLLEEANQMIQLYNSAGHLKINTYPIIQ